MSSVAETTAAPAATAGAAAPAATALDGDPAVAVAELAGQRDPFLIGVRHHSPALSVVLPDLLDRYAPEALLLELPPELGQWLPWLADPDTTAPVALAGAVGDAGLAFYPFADFSPELAAVRWAHRHGVPVVPCDLPLADRAWHEREQPTAGPAGQRLSLASALKGAATGRADEDMWDRMVEARAPGADPEAVRRAALLVGWALRRDAETGDGVSTLDLRREAHMRGCLAEHAGKRVAMLVGAFHAPALREAGPVNPAATGPKVVTSLVAYTFGLLDARSGYPAGIRDPQWQQSVLTAGGDPAQVEAAALAAVVAVCAKVRAAGHPAGPAEAREAVRLAVDLARLRGLPAPGRGELVEALQSVLAHGEVLGRGRVVATAMEHVMVGDRRGRLAPGTPRSGLGPAVRELLAALRLPGPGDAAKDTRLDPLRSDLDRRREVTLQRLAACGVTYAEPVAGDGGAGGVDAITSRWRLQWTPHTEAGIEVAGLRGVTLEQATEGALGERRRRETTAGGPTAAEIVAGLHDAAVCGLPALAARRLDEVATVVPAQGSLTEAMTALALLDRLRHGHVPGLPEPDRAAVAAAADAVETAAVRQVDGLAGSEAVDDARALAALAQRAEASGAALRLADALTRLAARGTPLMAAAAGAVRVLLGHVPAEEFGVRVASWVDTAGTDEARRALQGHVSGLLAVAEPLLQAASGVLTGLLDRVETLPDGAFLARLPALRGGFHTASPAGRERLLAVVDERLGGHVGDLGDVDDPDALLARLLADRAGRAALVELGLLASGTPGRDSAVSGTSGHEPAVSGTPDGDPIAGPANDDGLGNVAAPANDGSSAGAAARSLPAPPGGQGRPARPVPSGELSPADRWRLILGRDRPGMGGKARRYATALDELYGMGRGEGSREDRSPGAGREPSFPGVREWSEELSVLFGPGVREEVLAAAVESGRLDAALELDPEAVRPSMDLLRDVLSLAGGLPEATVARLRPLVARIIAELTRELATTLRPALNGLTTPRPTSRPGGRLDLARTLRANMATARRGEDGRVTVVPERPVFRTRARRGVDWRLVLVVDVSGSMEESVIWSALTASVLAGVPALTTHFVAFSTEVVDLTDRVGDPLSLLLEVKVGGGTHIAAGLRHARSLVTVPTRTLVVLISDFEEGYGMGGLLAEVRALVESGATVLGCASLDDAGRPRYSVSAAGQLVAAGMPIAALSPLELARWVGEQVRS
ncbi:vWA domain-containing protein [Catellatospora methionotrophica]|uniref:vWA domain-containing protein n=1 Tax=Catellatospora methionotrophica TaxID=121620 RepID=UPI00341019A6